ncbi:MAG: hypothetical protein ACYTFQ_21245 [Planctomycetota bacterium]|jgi:hypothetical protein
MSGYTPVTWEYYDDDQVTLTDRFVLSRIMVLDGWGLFREFPLYEPLRTFTCELGLATKKSYEIIKKELDNAEPDGSLDNRKDNDMSKITKKLVTDIVETIIGDQLTDATWDDAALIHEVVGHALEIHEKNRKEPKIYGAYDREGTFHSLFTGRKHDIEAWLNNDEFEAEELIVTDVPSGYAAHRENIVAKRDLLLAEAAELTKRLNDRDVH